MKLKRKILGGLLTGMLLVTPATVFGAQTHQVKGGETLWRIGQSYQVTPVELKKWNDLTSNVIYEGQILQVNQNSDTQNKGGTQRTIATTMYVGVSELNVRVQPSTQQPIRGMLRRGETVKKLEERGEWSLVSTALVKGWVMTQYLSNSYPANSFSAKTVLLDAGHGGNDPGSIGYDGTKEEELTLQITLKLQKKLMEKGYKVEMIRTGDTSCNNLTNVSKELQCRVQKSRSTQADIYVSIHINSGLNGQGTETYYNMSNPYPMQSMKLAKSIHENYQPVFNSLDRGVKTENYYVIKHNTIPATLLEIGFITSFSDLPKMKDSETQEAVANGIAAGIDEYFGKK